MANMWLMCGLSGGGKTTFSNQFATEHHIKRLGVDDYYAKVNGDEIYHHNFFNVWIEFFKAIHECEMNNEDIIIDTNALTKGNREQFLEWFPSFHHHLIFMDCDFEQCLKNNSTRRRRIPDTRMHEMYERLEAPDAKTENTGWETITRIVNRGNHFSAPIRIR